MKKILVTYIPASTFLVFLAMVLFAFGGCGGDGGGGSLAGGGGGDETPPAVTLTGLTINGPSSMDENSTATYAAAANWSDGTTSTVTSTWSVNSQMASISPGGVLSCQGGVASDQTVTIIATYSSGGITETDTMDVTITNKPTEVTLTGLYIKGPSTMIANSTATYTARAIWSDDSMPTVTPTWSVSSSVGASISPGGVLSCNQTIVNDEMATVTAIYSSGGITKTATKNVTITNKPTTKPFTAHMLSGAILFGENINAGGSYDSFLLIFNADSSFEQYNYWNPPDTSDYKIGTWSIDAFGKLLMSISGQGTVTVGLIGDLIYVPEVLVDDGTGTPYTVIWERSGPGLYPFYSSALPGTYVNQFGDTWIFNSNGTGSTTGDGGWTFTWSVDSGILKVVFPNGYVGSMYLRQTTQDSLTSYTILKWAFVLKTPTGDFYFYYGGMELTRQ